MPDLPSSTFKAAPNLCPLQSPCARGLLACTARTTNMRLRILRGISRGGGDLMVLGSVGPDQVFLKILPVDVCLSIVRYQSVKEPTSCVIRLTTYDSRSAKSCCKELGSEKTCWCSLPWLRSGFEAGLAMTESLRLKETRQEYPSPPIILVSISFRQRSKTISRRIPKHGQSLTRIVSGNACSR